MDDWISVDRSKLIPCHLHDVPIEIKTGGYFKGDMVISFYGTAGLSDSTNGVLHVIGGVKYSISGCQDATYLPTKPSFDEERIW